MNIISACKDDQIFRGYLADEEDSIASWSNWLTALRVVYGLPIKKASKRQLVEECTGRSYDQLPADGFDTALFLIGRRSGKSRIAAIIGAYEACIAKRRRLARGEKALVAICSPSKSQSKIVKEYLRAIFEAEMLSELIARETRSGFALASGVEIEVMAGDWRTTRGFSVYAAICDEICFMGVEEESKVRSDTVLVRAIKPSLATVGGKLICISSPYARRGWAFKTWSKHFGNDTGRTLVWNCPSRAMNPTLDLAIVQEYMDEDMQAAKSEWLGEWRDSVSQLLAREEIERLVMKGTKELLPRERTQYFAFADLSGGRQDDTALSIGFSDRWKVVISALHRYRPPFNPYQIIGEMSEVLKRYNIRRVTGDNFSAEFCVAGFESHGIVYTKCDKPKAKLYLELLPRVNSAELQLPDDPVLVHQLASLERRTRSGGADIVDHPVRGHDDLANVVAGVSYVCGQRTIRAGAIFR